MLYAVTIASCNQVFAKLYLRMRVYMVVYIKSKFRKDAAARSVATWC